MRWVSTSQTVAPSAEPISTADLKAFLNYEDTDQDSLIAALGASARAYCEEYTRRALITQTWQGHFETIPIGGEVWLPRPRISSITDVKYYDSDNVLQTLTTSSYHKVTGDNGLIKVIDGPGVHANRPDRYQVNWVSGYGSAGSDVPEQLLTAMKMLVVFWFENRVGDTRGNMFVGKDVEVPMPIRVLMDQFRVPVER